MMTTTTTTRITKLSVGLLASVIALSSIAGTQLLLGTNSNVAFAAENCTDTETEETFESVCSGGESTITGEESDPRGGRGGHGTCTTDLSTGIQTCTSSGGGGGRSDDSAGGGGGRSICTPGEEPETIDCSVDVGGGGGNKGA